MPLYAATSVLNAQNPRDGREGAVAPAHAAEGQQDGGGEASGDEADAQRSREEDARRVAVADGPAHEVGVGLAAEGGLDGPDEAPESGWVRGVGEGLNGGLLLPGGQVQLAGGPLHDVRRDDPVDFLAERLDCDWSGGQLPLPLHKTLRGGILQGCLAPATAKASEACER